MGVARISKGGVEFNFIGHLPKSYYNNVTHLKLHKQSDYIYYLAIVVEKEIVGPS